METLLNDRSAPNDRSYTLYQVLTLMAQIKTESLLNDESTPDGRSYSLYRVLTLTTQIYAESLLNDGSIPDGRSYSVCQVFTLAAQIYTEALLKDESSPDGSDSLYRVLTLTSTPNLHRTLALTTKRRYRDIEKNHPGGKLRQVLTLTPSIERSETIMQHEFQVSSRAPTLRGLIHRRNPLRSSPLQGLRHRRNPPGSSLLRGLRHWRYLSGSSPL